MTKNNFKFLRLLTAIIACGFLLASAAAPLPAADTDQQDGPYVFRMGNQRIVCALQNGEVITTRHPAGKRLNLGVPAVPGLKVTVPAGSPKSSRRFSFRTREKIFALSDVHGQFKRLREILLGNGIINEKYAWTFGRGHLVMVGDVFDRGPMVTECLWLLVHLQAAAARAGGRVHVLLGNHDQMVMRDDLRYVNKRYKKIARALHRIPYPDLFGPDTYLGSWLRARPAVIRINRTLFVHAGIHPRLVQMNMSMRRINRTVRRHMDSSGVVHAFNPVVKAIFGRNGVFWSRGYFQLEDYDPVNKAGLARVLEFFGASRVVVGHTRFDHVATHMDGLVLGTAVNTEDDLPAEGLMIKNNRFYRADATGKLTPVAKNH